MKTATKIVSEILSSIDEAGDSKIYIALKCDNSERALLPIDGVEVVHLQNENNRKRDIIVVYSNTVAELYPEGHINET